MPLTSQMIKHMLLEAQSYKCDICGEPIDATSSLLDFMQGCNPYERTSICIDNLRAVCRQCYKPSNDTIRWIRDWILIPFNCATPTVKKHKRGKSSSAVIAARKLPLNPADFI